MIKILFNNDVTTDLDLSDRIISIDVLNRRVESDKPGEAGLIVFDNIVLEFPLSAFPNNDFDFANIAANGNYVFDIKYRYKGVTYALFQGLTDKASIQHTSAHTVRFEVLDKLSALALVERQNQRNIVDDFFPIAADPDTVSIDVEPASYNASENKTRVYIKGYDDENTHTNLSASPFSNGQILEDSNDPSHRFYFRENDIDDGSNWYREAYVHGDVSGSGTITYSADKGVLYSRYVYGEYIHQGGAFGAIDYFDALSLVSAIVHLSWTGIPILNKTGASAVDMHLDFFPDTIFDRPLDEHPLDALKFLSKSMRVYMYMDHGGQLVLQDNFFNDSGYEVDLSGYNFLDYSLFYRWDKSVDYVLIKSLGGRGLAPYDPADAATYGEYPADIKKKPQNTYERDVFLLNDADTLNGIAGEYYDFYNPLREAAEITVKLDDVTIGLDLCKKVRLNLNGTATYFIEALQMDLIAAEVTFKAVKIA